MDLTTLLKIATTRLVSKRGGISTSDLAFAEVNASGKIEAVNPLARMKWGWQKGEMIQDEVRIALEGLAGKKPTELPLTLGGLHVGAIAQDKKAGWLTESFGRASSFTGRLARTQKFTNSTGDSA